MVSVRSSRGAQSAATWYSAYSDGPEAAKACCASCADNSWLDAGSLALPSMNRLGLPQAHVRALERRHVREGWMGSLGLGR